MLPGSLTAFRLVRVSRGLGEHRGPDPGFARKWRRPGFNGLELVSPAGVAQGYERHELLKLRVDRRAQVHCISTTAPYSGSDESVAPTMAVAETDGFSPLRASPCPRSTVIIWTTWGTDARTRRDCRNALSKQASAWSRPTRLSLVRLESGRRGLVHGAVRTKQEPGQPGHVKAQRPDLSTPAPIVLCHV